MSGHTIAERSSLESCRPSDWTAAWLAINVCRWLETSAKMPESSLITELSSPAPSAPAAKRHLSDRDSGSWRNSAQPLHGIIFEIFVEMSAIVSDTLKQVPIDCAIS